jgi:hypothetical protein
MTLRDTIEADATTVFCNDQDFAETVTYWPRGASTGRAIKAVVIRDQIATFSEDGGQTNLPSFQVFVANTATGGISSSEIDTGGDKIELPPRDGKTAEKRSITQITEQDHGMLVIECR